MLFQDRRKNFRWVPPTFVVSRPASRQLSASLIPTVPASTHWFHFANLANISTVASGPAPLLTVGRLKKSRPCSEWSGKALYPWTTRPTEQLSSAPSTRLRLLNWPLLHDRVRSACERSNSETTLD